MSDPAAFDPTKPLVPLLEVEEFTGEMRALAERAIKRSGRIPNQQRAMANSEALGPVQRLFFEDLWARGTLPKELRLLIRYKVSTNNDCVYCAAHQIFHLNALGDHAEKIRHIHDFETHPAFSERERAALAFADAMTGDATKIPDSIARRLVEHFTPAERVEVALVAGAMGFMNRLNDSLRIPLEESAAQYAGIGLRQPNAEASNGASAPA